MGWGLGLGLALLTVVPELTSARLLVSRADAAQATATGAAARAAGKVIDLKRQGGSGLARGVEIPYYLTNETALVPTHVVCFRLTRVGCLARETCD